MHTRRDQVRTALANTYQWIWKHPKYEEWYSADGSDKSSILWIRGKPGSGKSTLAKMIRASLGPLSSGLLPSSSGIETYSESDTTNATQSGPKSYDGSSRDVVADYFFSSRSGERSRSPKWMLQALLYQILAQNPKLYGHFRESFENIRASREAWNYDVLKQIFISLCTEVNQERVFIAPRFYLVIDAIDESESYNNIDRTDILDVLSTLCVQHNTGKKPACILKVLLIGRPTSDIDSKLRAFNSIEMHKQTLSDIEEIVSSGLDSILQSLRDPANRTSEMRDDDYDDDEEKHKSMVRKELEETNASDLIFIREYLLEHANGIILWVVLILKELTSLFLDGFWTLREIREMLSSLPRDLEQCYEEMIRRILKEVEKSGTRSRYGKERHLEKTLTMLSWAAFAFRPLTIQEFREIIAIGDFEARKVMPQAGLGSEPSTVVLAEHRLHNQKQVHKAVLYFCSGFLETVDGARLMTSKSRKYVSDTDILQLLHRSAKDFLLRNPRARPFQLQLASSSSSIALLSIKYLKLSFEVQDLAPHPESWEPDAYVHFINHLKSLPLLTYILFSLPKHLQATQSSELADDLSDYLSTLQHSSNTYAWRFLESWARQHKLLPRTNPDNDASNFRLRCSSLAAELGESEVVKLCIEAGVRDLSETLLAASRCGDLATVKAIFDQGQVRNLTSCKEAFFNSVQRGHLSIVNLIISSGTIQPDVRTDRGASALHRAAAEGHLRVLKYLISSGSDLEAEDENGVRPLHVAALSGKRAVVELLVSSGANLQRHTNKISKYEHTALTFAAMSGHLDIVKFLTRKYEQLDDMDVSGSIAMIREDGEQAIELAKTNRHIEVTLRLKEAWVRAESKSFAMFKLEDFDVAEAKARRRRGLGGEDNLQEAGLSREKAEEQNKLIESLIGGDLNPRESMHLLSLAQPSDERSRGTQRFSRAFLKSPQSSGGDGSNF
jgi:ankyrin repeat protein/energy-coupling factor transporter ATP-binding protein EcfA2